MSFGGHLAAEALTATSSECAIATDGSLYVVWYAL